MIFFTVVHIVIFIGLSWVLVRFKKTGHTLAVTALAGLLLGALLGAYLNLCWGALHPVTLNSLAWFNIAGEAYLRLLQMIVIPLVFISILAAVVQLTRDTAAVGKISALLLAILLATTAVAAVIGIVIVNFSGLSASGLLAGSEESQYLARLQGDKLAAVADLTAPQFLLSFIPRNLFWALTGAAPTAIISVVLISVLLGLAVVAMTGKNPGGGAKIIAAVELVQAWILELTALIIALTPIGVMALITALAAHADGNNLVTLGYFALASYLAFLLMFAVHGLLLTAGGINPLIFFKKITAVLVFAFTSRSSAAAIPLNIKVQTEKLGVNAPIAGFAASLGATVGQNGCAGIYPAMLAVMTAPLAGINPWDFAWLAKLTLVVTLSSLGVAGVGGGAVFASLMVLPTMGLPITLIALLLAIEPLIDMGRTALNVSGTMTAGVLTAKILGQFNSTAFKKRAD